MRGKIQLENKYNSNLICFGCGKSIEIEELMIDCFSLYEEGIFGTSYCLNCEVLEMLEDKKK